MKVLATITLALSGAVVAVAAPYDESMLPTQPPQVQHAGDVGYLNGGVGEEEVRWMKAQATDFPLQIVISGRGGEYGVADSLTIKRGNEEIVSVPDAGPWVMLDVPAGRYTLEAHFGGQTERRTVQVTGKGTQRINWNTLAASD